MVIEGEASYSRVLVSDRCCGGRTTENLWIVLGFGESEVQSPPGFC